MINNPVSVQRPFAASNLTPQAMSSKTSPSLSGPDLGAWLNPAPMQQPPYWVQALLGPWFDKGDISLSTARRLFFGFPESLPPYFQASDAIEGFAPLAESERDTVRAVFGELASIIDLHFEETSEFSQPNTIAIMTNRQVRTDGYAWGPGKAFKSYDIFLDNDPGVRFAVGSFDALTLIHEIGHALGLRHPFEGTEPFSSGGLDPALNGAEDSTLWTVMSYTGYRAQFRPELRPFDIAALQWLYGPSQQARAGNDRYVLSSKEANFIWDGAGFDTIDATGVDAVHRDYYGDAVGATDELRLVLDLQAGRKGYIDNAFERMSLPGQITINAGTVIEAVIGTASRDWIYGNEVANQLEGRKGNDLLVGREGDDSLWGGEGADSLYGGPGADLLDGGEGLDWVFCDGPLLAYNLQSLDQGRFLLKAHSARDQAADRLIDVERIHFSDVTLVLQGDPFAFWAARMIAILGGVVSLKDASLGAVAVQSLEQGLSPQALAARGIEVMFGPQATTRELIAKAYQNYQLSGLVSVPASEHLLDELSMAAQQAGLGPSHLLIWACGLPTTDELIRLSGIDTQGWALQWPVGP